MYDHHELAECAKKFAGIHSEEQAAQFKKDEFQQLELRWSRIHRKEVADGVKNPISFSDFYKKNKNIALSKIK